MTNLTDAKFKMALVVHLFHNFAHYLGTLHDSYNINPFRPEFTIVIFNHYNPRIAAAILDL